MREPFVINGEKIKPGQYRVVSLEMPRLYDSTPLSMQVHVFHGRESGPVLGITAAIHGDEINGIEIIRRILKKPNLKKVKGTLILVPIVNMYGFLYQDRYLLDRRDLNRYFPGSESGSLASRLNYLLTKEVINQCTHCIDLHTGSLHRSNLPQIRINLDDPVTTELAMAFKASVILNSGTREGSLRDYTSQKNIPLLLYEAGEALRFDELSIRTGVNGILNVMDALGMMVKKQHKISATVPAKARRSFWVRCPVSGLIQAKKLLGASIKKGDILAVIGNPTSAEKYLLRSPLSGIVIGKNNLPMVHEGAALFNIATFEDLDLASEHIDNVQEHFDGQLD